MVNEKNAQIREAENRVKQKENTLNQKMSEADRKNKELENQKILLKNQQDALKVKEDEYEELRGQVIHQIETIAGMSAQDAKAQLMESMKAEARTEAQAYINDCIDEARLNAAKEAKRIVINTIQRTATETAIENAVTTFPIENLTITESKRRVERDGSFVFDKHKIFLYKEDFEKFQEGLQEAVQYILHDLLHDQPIRQYTPREEQESEEF